jgi:hypothetical protein
MKPIVCASIQEACANGWVVPLDPVKAGKVQQALVQVRSTEQGPPQIGSAQIRTS